MTSPRALKSTFEGRTVQFRKGTLQLDGRQALAYARVRKNELDDTDSDVSRGQRGQQVIAAIRSKLSSPTALFRLRSVGETVADPLATDLSASEIVQLGWVSWRAQRNLQCNLGGEPSQRNGQSTPQRRRRREPPRDRRVPRPHGGAAGAAHRHLRGRVPRDVGLAAL